MSSSSYYSGSSSSADNLVEAFNSKATATMTPRIHMKELKPKRRYFITSFKEVQVPKTGRAVIAVLEVPERGEEGDQLFDCFLPRRFTAILSSERIAEYNETPDLCLRYLGIGDNREFIVKLVNK